MSRVVNFPEDLDKGEMIDLLKSVSQKLNDHAAVIGFTDLAHVRYIRVKKDLDKQLYYIGGENNPNLTIGKLYDLCKAAYAEKKDDNREEVWICIDDLGEPHHLMTNEWGNQVLNFTDKSGLRDYKLKQIV